MKASAKRLWRGWKALAEYIGDFQARLLLTVFYFTVLAPFGLALRLLADPLEVRRLPAESGWTPRQTPDVDVRAARQQF